MRKRNVCGCVLSSRPDLRTTLVFLKSRSRIYSSSIIAIVLRYGEDTSDNTQDTAKIQTVSYFSQVTDLILDPLY